MLHITDFEIVRNVTTGPHPVVDCPRGKPLRVLTILNEQDFLKDQVVRHAQNVFIEDYIHDWNYHPDKKKLAFYSRIGVTMDILLVYGEETIKPKMNYCPMTGRKL